MTVVALPGREPPKPNSEIVLLLRGLLTQAEAGELQEIGAGWIGPDGNFLSAAYGPDQHTLGARLYALAHELLMESYE